MYSTSTPTEPVREMATNTVPPEWETLKCGMRTPRWGRKAGLR